MQNQYNRPAYQQQTQYQPNPYAQQQPAQQPGHMQSQQNHQHQMNYQQNPQGCQPQQAGYAQNRPTHAYQQQQNPDQMQYQPGHAGPAMGNTPVPHGVDPQLWGWFQSVDNNKSGSITSNELQQALLNNNWSHFNAETCRLMIGMFDRDKSGTIDIHEFAALWKYIQDWKACFDGFDADRSGTISAPELSKAFTTFGYRLSQQFCDLCVRIFDTSNAYSMKFDSFIQCCVMLKTLTDAFRRFDTNQSGVVNINYEQFMDMVISHNI